MREEGSIGNAWITGIWGVGGKHVGIRDGMSGVHRGRVGRSRGSVGRGGKYV